MSRKAQNRVAGLLAKTPGLSVVEIAAVTGYTESAVEHHLTELRRRGALPTPAVTDPQGPITWHPEPAPPVTLAALTDAQARMDEAPRGAYDTNGNRIFDIDIVQGDLQPVEAIAAALASAPRSIHDITLSLIACPPDKVKEWAHDVADELGLSLADFRMTLTSLDGVTFGQLAGRVVRGEVVSV